MAKVNKKSTAKAAVGKEVEDGTACAILSYLVIGVFWYLFDENMKKNAYAKFHARQGFVLWVVSIALYIAVALLSLIFFFFTWLVMIIAWVCNLGILALVIIGIINAAKGEKKDLPIVGHFAEKLAI